METTETVSNMMDWEAYAYEYLTTGDVNRKRHRLIKEGIRSVAETRVCKHRGPFHVFPPLEFAKEVEALILGIKKFYAEHDSPDDAICSRDPNICAAVASGMNIIHSTEGNKPHQVPARYLLGEYKETAVYIVVVAEYTSTLYCFQTAIGALLFYRSFGTGY